MEEHNMTYSLQACLWERSLIPYRVSNHNLQDGNPFVTGFIRSIENRLEQLNEFDEIR